MLSYSGFSSNSNISSSNEPSDPNESYNYKVPSGAKKEVF